MSIRRQAGLGAGVLVAAVAAYALADAFMPSGLPPGIVLLGLVLGALSSLVAMGLVLVYRAFRIVNFAQVAMGAVGASLAVVLKTGFGWPYLPAVACGLALSLLVGWATDLLFDWRFSKSPRLIVTVATIALLLLLSAIQVGLPHIVDHSLSLASTFAFPFHHQFLLNPTVFDTDDILALVAVPVIAAALWWFFSRTDTGLGVRGAADSAERSLLLGIPVRRLNRVVWVLAAGLSGVSAILAAPITQNPVGVPAGPEDLLAPLAAAVLARFESLPATVAWSLGIGVLQQSVYWSFHSYTYSDIALFALILVGLLLQPASRGADRGLGDWVAVRQVKRIPAAVAALPEVRITRMVGLGAVVAAAVLLPTVFSLAVVGPLAIGAIYAMLAVSLVVLTGWGGQISLGQFAFAGIGAALTGALLVARGRRPVRRPGLLGGGWGRGGLRHRPAGPAPARPATGGGHPGLRRGRVRMAPLAPVLPPAEPDPDRPAGAVRPLGPVVADRQLRAVPGGPGSVAPAGPKLPEVAGGPGLLASRDGPQTAASFGISPWRAQLTGFALSGAVCGVAGGLYVVAVGTGFNGVNPDLSVTVFTMAVIGGLGSLTGGLLGAAYVFACVTWLPNGLATLATGAGLLLVLALFPEGLAGVVFGLRDRLLGAVARRRGLEVAAPGVTDLVEPAVPITAEEVDQASVLLARGLHVSIGSTEVLRGVDFSVGAGEVVALLGTNGAGKSTLLRAVAGLLPASQGSVRFGGEDMDGWSPARRVRAGLVTVPGGRGVFPSLTVAENLRLAGWTERHHHGGPGGPAPTRARVAELFPALERRRCCCGPGTSRAASSRCWCWPRPCCAGPGCC